MRIALVQLNAYDRDWNPDLIPRIAQLTPDVDLIVFPEYMPFAKSTALHEAISRLASATSNCGKIAIIAGGLVTVAAKDRNAVFLSHQGKIKGEYFKRIPWQEDDIVLGTNGVKFQWDDFACIPLICADAADNKSREGKKLIKETSILGAGEDCPIVVSSYGAWLNDDYWKVPLQGLSKVCKAPVLICGISGTGDVFTDYDGITGNFGGGGSGVFWPDGAAPIQRKHRGVHVVDLVSRKVESRNI